MDEFENAGTMEATANAETPNVDTASTDVNDTPTENEDINNETTPEKTFTQEQVNEFVRNRIERERNSTYKRYGVNDRDGLDSLINKSHSYDAMKERYENITKRNSELEQEIAFIRQNIEPSRQDDVMAYFKGKGLEFSENALVEELRTHPEWLRVNEVSDKPTTTIKKLGAQQRTSPEPEDEKKKVFDLFNI